MKQMIDPNSLNFDDKYAKLEGYNNIFYYEKDSKPSKYIEIRTSGSPEVDIIDYNNALYFFADKYFLYKYNGINESCYYPRLGKSNTRHYILSDKNVKTLFGNQSIYSADGTGNIDLYKHNVKIYNEDIIGGNVSIYLIIISSKNTSIDSLTDLKTYLANDTYYACSGYIDKTSADICYPIMALEKENDNWYYISNNDGTKKNKILLSAGTFTDTITTV